MKPTRKTKQRIEVPKKHIEMYEEKVTELTDKVAELENELGIYKRFGLDKELPNSKRKVKCLASE